MTQSRDDDAATVRAALGSLLTDEPPIAWSVADDEARGRARRTARRARIGAVVALVAVLATSVALLRPFAASTDGERPTPLTSTAPSPTASPSTVSEYLASLGWQVSLTQDIHVPQTDDVVHTYAVHRADAPLAARLVVYVHTSPSRDDMATSAAAGVFRYSACGGTCPQVHVTAVDCATGSCPSEAFAVVTQPLPANSVGDVDVERTWRDGTRLEAVAVAAQCAPCRPDGSSPGADASWISVEQIGRVLDLLGKPPLRSRQIAGTFMLDDVNPFDRLATPRDWLDEQILVLASSFRDASVTVGPPDNGAMLVRSGDTMATVSLSLRGTTRDAPECLSLPNCKVVQGWTTQPNGTTQVAVTQSWSVGLSTAIRGPSYEVLVRQGARMVMVTEDTTFPTLLVGQKIGLVVDREHLAAAALAVRFPASPAPSPSAS